MKKIYKTILMVLAIFMLSNAILPSISSASKDSKTINVTLYKDKWWAESLYQLQSHLIRYLKQCIYKINKGEYPKIFNIIGRVKWNTKLNTHFYSLLV